MGTYILGGSNTNDDTGVLNAQGDVNALSDVIVTNDLTVSGTAEITGDSTLSNASLSGTLSVTGDSTLASTTASSLTVSDTLTSPNINASASPLDLQVAGSTVATLDSSGNLTADGYGWFKGNNLIQGNASQTFTTTSTSDTAITSVAITPKSSGNIHILFLYFCSNNTIGDGLNLRLYVGSSSGALTTLYSTISVTQEGLAGNDQLLGVSASGIFTVGTTYYWTPTLSVNTGGTASASLLYYRISED